MTHLEKMILAGSLPESEESWGGAGVIISPKAPTESQKAMYPNDIHVVTPHYKLATAAVEHLRDLFYDAELMDYSNKYEFFGRLAEAMNVILAAHPEADGRQLSLAAVREARSILSDWTGNRDE